MRYLALATDYDGTLAADGKVADQTWDAVKRLRDSGRKLLLVTGRELDDLQRTCPSLEQFDRIIAENGALLYNPLKREERLLAPAPPEDFVRVLRQHKVPVSVGRSIVASWRPHETTILEAIRDLGLEMQVIFNKDAVMVLPPGVNKASGLKAALEELGLSEHSVVGIGDAENDHAFLALCECSAVVSNALPKLKERADLVTRGDHGRGVIELIDELLADDLRGREERLSRHHILLGHRPDDGEVRVPPYGSTILISGPSGSGKSKATTGLMERLAEAGYQFCVIDPEGDYQNLEEAVVLGDPQRVPGVDEVMQLLCPARQNVVVNLLDIPLSDRPLFFASLLPRLQELRAHTGRPHWLILDEAHHLFPTAWQSAPDALPQQLNSALLITVHPEMVSPAVLPHVNIVLAVGDHPADTFRAFAAVLGETPPRHIPEHLKKGEVAVWFRTAREVSPMVVEVTPARTERRRHSRKYAEGVLVPERSFYFRGPDNKLNLRAHNLWMFLELAAGVDDATWLHHLRQGDYARWFGEVIGDKKLAEEVESVEKDEHLSAADSRDRIRAAVERRYTAPVNAVEPLAGGFLSRPMKNTPQPHRRHS
jgi:HAD superfamily hydrolase (TIGR01484 family)